MSQVGSPSAAIWVEVIRLSGQLIGTAASALFVQYVYATFLAGKPEEAWLVILFRKFEAWRRRALERRLAWVNSRRHVAEPRPDPGRIRPLGLE